MKIAINSYFIPKSVFFMMSLHFQNNWVTQKNIFLIILKNLISIIWSSKNIGILCSRSLVFACPCSKSQIYTFHFLYISLSTPCFWSSANPLNGQIVFISIWQLIQYSKIFKISKKISEKFYNLCRLKLKLFL